MEQMDFPFPVNQQKLQEFITRLLVIEYEEDRLREEKRLLKDDYLDHMPMRAVLTAVKVVRAKHKLAEHAKEPFSYVHQVVLEHAVAEYMREGSIEELAANLLRGSDGMTVKMFTEETP